MFTEKSAALLLATPENITTHDTVWVLESKANSVLAMKTTVWIINYWSLFSANTCICYSGAKILF